MFFTTTNSPKIRKYFLNISKTINASNFLKRLAIYQLFLVTTNVYLQTKTKFCSQKLAAFDAFVNQGVA